MILLFRVSSILIVLGWSLVAAVFSSPERMVISLLMLGFINRILRPMLSWCNHRMLSLTIRECNPFLEFHGYFIAQMPAICISVKTISKEEITRINPSHHEGCCRLHFGLGEGEIPTCCPMKHRPQIGAPCYRWVCSPQVSPLPWQVKNRVLAG